jgi:hypothetical protein
VWIGFAGVTGGAAGGFTALAFIVVAIQADAVNSSRAMRIRVGQTLDLFLTVLVLAALFTLPQRAMALGIEMLVVALASGTLLAALDGATRRSDTTGPGTVLVMTTRAVQAVVIGATGLGGLLILIGQPWGRYLYAGAVTFALLWGVYGAWSFVTGQVPAGRQQKPGSASVLPDSDAADG